MSKAIVSLAAIAMLSAATGGCRWFNDDGAQFASETADFPEKFRASKDATAVFEYTPIKGNNQRIWVGIGRLLYCPNPPCEGQGAATVRVEKGQSGTGYRLGAAASVPEPLEIQKERGPIRVHMRKAADGTVEIVGLE